MRFEMWPPVIRWRDSNHVYDEHAAHVFRVPEICYASLRSHGVTSKKEFLTLFRNEVRYFT